MSIRIRIARTAEDLDGLFRTRHRVFVEQEGVMRAQADARIFAG